jgi:molecular chaperone DnaK
MPQIEITLDVDANGILKVSAKDKKTGKENKITIKANSGLTEEEIQRMVQDAEANADADAKARKLVDAKNSADAQLHNIRKELADKGDKLTDEQRTKITEAVTAVEAAVTAEDADAITDALSKLWEPAAALFTVDAPVEPQVQPAETNSETPADVVDAEFTEVKKDA